MERRLTLRGVINLAYGDKNGHEVINIVQDNERSLICYVWSKSWPHHPPDDNYEYRHVRLPKQLVKFLPPGIAKEEEWRGIGVRQSAGWEMYMRHEPEPHVLLFKVSELSDSKTPLFRSSPSLYVLLGLISRIIRLIKVVCLTCFYRVGWGNRGIKITTGNIRHWVNDEISETPDPRKRWGNKIKQEASRYLIINIVVQ